jgi:hypothetical protein
VGTTGRPLLSEISHLQQGEGITAPLKRNGYLVSRPHLLEGHGLRRRRGQRPRIAAAEEKTRPHKITLGEMQRLRNSRSAWSIAPTTSAPVGSGSVPTSGRTKRGFPILRTSSPARFAARAVPRSGRISIGIRSRCDRWDFGPVVVTDELMNQGLAMRRAELRALVARTFTDPNSSVL